MSNKPMRAAMPEVTAFVDACRDRGMTDNETLRQGMQDGSFSACEGGQEVGRQASFEPVLDEAGNVVGRRVGDCVAVVPVLPLAMEVRHLEREWRERTKGQA